MMHSQGLAAAGTARGLVAKDRSRRLPSGSMVVARTARAKAVTTRARTAKARTAKARTVRARARTRAKATIALLA